MSDNGQEGLGGAVARGWEWLLPNFDVGLSLLLSAGVVVASFFTDISTDTIAQVTLAVLTLLTLSLIRDRLRRDETDRTLVDTNDALAGLTALWRPSSRLHVSRDQSADDAAFKAIIDDIAEIDEARYLAFSSRDARKFIEQVAVKSTGAVQVLLKHPETVGATQRRWILAELDRLFKYTVPKAANRIEIRCYRAPYSLRGKKLSPAVINVGWYTPLIGDVAEVIGHKNPLITAPLDSEEGAALARMFDGLFDALWSDPETEEAAAVINRLDASTSDPSTSTSDPVQPPATE